MMTLFRRRSYWPRGTRALSSVKSEEVPRAGFLFLRAAAVLLLADGDAIFGYPISYRSGEFGVIRKRQPILFAEFGYAKFAAASRQDFRFVSR